MTVSVSDQPVAVRLEALPSSRIRGTVSDTSEGPKISGMEVGFTLEGASPLTAQVQCPVNADGSWTCDLPAGTLDLRLKSRGYMAQYRWNANLPAGGESDLGAFTLKQGASVVGRVEIDERNVSGRIPRVSSRFPRVSRRFPRVSRRIPRVSRRIPRVSLRFPRVSRRIPRVSRRIPPVWGRVSRVAVGSPGCHAESPGCHAESPGCHSGSPVCHAGSPGCHAGSVALP